PRGRGLRARGGRHVRRPHDPRAGAGRHRPSARAAVLVEPGRRRAREDEGRARRRRGRRRGQAAGRGRPGVVIVRISNEGQYRLDDSHHARLDELDDAVVAEVSAKSEDGFQRAFEALLHFVRTEGEPLDADDLEPSEYILPPPDLTFAEAG